MQLQSNSLLLREIHEMDIAFIHQLHSLPVTDQYNTSGIPESIQVTENLVKEWIKTISEIPRQCYFFLIENEVQKAIGIIGMRLGKAHYRNAEIWYKIHPDFWGNGYATEAVKALLTFGFKNLNLHRIEAGCAIENTGSIRVLEKTGFTREAHTRQLLPIRGQWHDNYGYAILEEDWEKIEKV